MRQPSPVPNSTALLSLVRRSEGLFAWTSDAPGDDHDAPVSCMALELLPTALYPGRDALLADWDSVRAARDAESVWPAFWRLFWNTQTEYRERSPVAVPVHVAPPPRPAATAAHPRAYRGTKFAPPKPAAVELDLGLWLSEDRLLDGYFSRHDFQRLPALDAHGVPLSGNAELPWTVSALQAHGFGPWPAMPDAFRRQFLWRCKGLPLPVMTAWLDVWRGTGGALAQPQAAMCARLCALAPASHAWAARALVLPPARQYVFLAALLKHRTYERDVAELSEAQAAELSALAADDERFAIYLDAVLSNLTRGASAAYTLIGCSLAARLPDANGFDRLASRLVAHADCSDVPVADIARMTDALEDDSGVWELSAWEYCSSLPGFSQVLRETCWEKLGKFAADRWLRTFIQITWEHEGKALAWRWRSHLAAFPKWHRALLSVPDAWQDKFMNILVDHGGRWEDRATFVQCIPYLLPLQVRLCHPPFAPNVDGTAVLFPMAKHLAAPGWQQLAACSDRHWLIAERACRRDNDAMLIGRGLYSLTRSWPDFAVHAFVAAPRRLMRTMRLFGCMEHERRRQFLAQASHTVWFANDWTSMPALDACRALSLLCLDAGMNSPLPRRLREHLEGKCVLSDAQIARHCRVAISRLPTVLLEALEHQIWAAIDASFNLRSRGTAASHAVRMLAGVDDNRNGLRRFLRAYCQGQPDAHLDHPLNRAWFARHPRIAENVWNARQASGQPRPHGDISVAIETDPLEILMLGTYVGSCLGLGGLCNYSAVACLLDANKQVIYARDAKGRVLARQLLAIDESDRLICFEIYPVTAGETLRQAFEAHNTALAAALGIDIFLNAEDDVYDVPVILSQYWWDDGAMRAPAE